MLIYFLRHGATACNAEGRYQGRRDIPLSPAGRAALGPADFSPEAVYVSPLARAAETAAILFPAAAQIPVPALAEMDFGVFEGRTWREMEHDGDYLYLPMLDLRYRTTGTTAPGWRAAVRAAAPAARAGRSSPPESAAPLPALWTEPSPAVRSGW